MADAAGGQLQTLNGTNSTDDCAVGGNFDQGATYRVLAIVTGTLSIIGTVFIVASFAAFRHLRASLGFRLIFFLSISNLISALQVVMQSANEHCANGACILGAWMSQFGNLSGIFWVAFIGLNFFLAISGVNHKASAVKFNKHKEKIFHSISWGLPGLFTVIAGSAGMFGVSGMWCWITGEFIAARIVMYDIWIIMVYIWSAFLLVWVCMKQRLMKEIPTVARRLIYYILVFFICNLFTIVGTFSFYLQREDTEWIRIAIALFEPLHGFLNALVYGLNVKVLESWKHLVACKRYHPEASSPTTGGSARASTVSRSTPELDLIGHDGLTHDADDDYDDPDSEDDDDVSVRGLQVDVVDDGDETI